MTSTDDKFEMILPAHGVQAYVFGCDLMGRERAPKDYDVSVALTWVAGWEVSTKRDWTSAAPIVEGAYDLKNAVIMVVLPDGRIRSQGGHTCGDLKEAKSEALRLFQMRWREQQHKAGCITPTGPSLSG